MTERTLRDLLNRLRWDAAEDPESVMLQVRVREAGEERMEMVAFDDVTEILAAGVTVADGTFLPYHRIVAVHGRSEPLWRRRERREEPR